MGHLERTFQAKGYNRNEIKKAMNPKPKINQSESVVRLVLGKAFVPYMYITNH